MSHIIAAHGLTRTFGRILAVDDFSFSAADREILGIIGPNGAGKTTLFDLLTGTLKPRSGHVFFNGNDVTAYSPSKRCRMGIGRTYQVPRPFENLTVYENALVGAVNGGGRSQGEAREEVDQVLDMVGLFPTRNHLSRELRFIDRKLLDIARVLATRPSVVLLDEPAAGVAEQDFHRILDLVSTIRENGIAIVWIEHILMMMTQGVDRLLVMAEGRELLNGAPAEVLEAREVLEAYVGSEGEECPHTCC